MRQKFEATLHTLGVKQLPKLHLFDILPSTNQKLWQLVDQGADEPTLVIASQQSAGKGQWGRNWQSELGGLYLSLFFRPQIPVSDGLLLTLCSAWGIARNLRRYNIPVWIKWFNDLLLYERKLGGILTETRLQQRIITHAVIGVGINWSNRVPKTAINLQNFEQINSLGMLAAIVYTGILSGYQHYLTEGIEELLPSYLELLHSRGRSVLVDGYPGKILGVATNGKLRIRLSASGATTEVLRSPDTITVGYD